MSDTENDSIEKTEEIVNTESLVKPAKKKLNLSDAERERRRQSILVAREKLQQKKALEREAQENYLKQREEELIKNVSKTITKLENKKKKEIVKQVYEAPMRKQKVIYESESDDEEEEVVVVTKQKLQPKTKAPIQQTAPQQPVALFRIRD